MTDTLARREQGDALSTILGCVEWQGHRHPDGYGRLAREGRWHYVHRLVWETLRGPIPVGLCVLHRCDNPPCYNIEHLFVGTKGDNIRDAITKGRWAPWHRGKTRCKHGHEFTPENTRTRANGSRACRACNAAAKRRQRDRAHV